ncbi:hypothetical protein [Parabacteroides massiliensis]|uniref:hypothetical protein n=1 Tax=Parabacteroides massiliensis TaxID=1750560 RepID=UPI001428907F|nr:hypothetical protein [Parabacteroides massiliensis]
METLLYILMHVCLLEAGEKDTRHDKNHMSGSAARQGDTPALPTSAAVGRIIGENGKKLVFLLALL